MENTYELMFVSAPDLKDDQLSALKAKVIEEMTGLGAVIEKEDDWGKRDLAFEVKDYHQGYYYLIHFKAPPDVPGKLKGYLRVNERIIRYLISTRVITPEPPPLVVEKPKEDAKPKEDMKPKEDVKVKEEPKARDESAPKVETDVKADAEPKEAPAEDS